MTGGGGNGAGQLTRPVFHRRRQEILERRRKIESLKRLILSEKGVSPVIGTILMVAVTVVMAAIIGGFVYQMARPQEVPNLATSLVDDARVILSDGVSNGRIAKLTIETGDIIAKNEVVILATYTDATEYTVTLDGASLIAGLAMTMSTTADMIDVTWVDSDGSADLSPGDRLDFTESVLVATDGAEVMSNTDFTVKITHKSSKATISNHTIKVY